MVHSAPSLHHIWLKVDPFWSSSNERALMAGMTIAEVEREEKCEQRGGLESDGKIWKQVVPSNIFT